MRGCAPPPQRPSTTLSGGAGSLMSRERRGRWGGAAWIWGRAQRQPPDAVHPPPAKPGPNQPPREVGDTPHPPIATRVPEPCTHLSAHTHHPPAPPQHGHHSHAPTLPPPQPAATPPPQRTPCSSSAFAGRNWRGQGHPSAPLQHLPGGRVMLEHSWGVPWRGEAEAETRRGSGVVTPPPGVLQGQLGPAATRPGVGAPHGEYF